MGFYFRKSIKLGALRFNFSKSGVGVSAGIKGFRIGTGPKGNYIHAGANGFYYRKTLGNTNKIATVVRDQIVVDSSEYDFKDIESGTVSFLTDSSFEEILSEINQKSSRFAFLPAATILSMIASLLNPILFVLLAILVPTFIILDKKRKTTYLIYDIEESRETSLQKFYDAFDSLVCSSKKWHISSQAGLNSDYQKKVNAGATNLIRRTPIAITFGLPKWIVLNVKVPVLPVGKQVLYFLPERILVKNGKQFGTINYRDLELRIGNTQFIESEGVPSDSKIVGRTWKYVNKKGGPDKRFKDNVELPILKYSEIHFTSRSGLNEIIQLSKPDLGQELVTALKTRAEI